MTAPPPGARPESASGPAFALARLHALVGDETLERGDFLGSAAALCSAGGRGIALQLRVRRAPAARLWTVAAALASLARERGAQLFVNDRLDVALGVGADGVHLREDSLPPDAARRLLRRCAHRSSGRALLGRSIHDPAQVDDPGLASVDYLVLGAVRRTGTHPGRRPLPPGALGEATARAKAPVLAIGGVTPESVSELMARGAYGVVANGGVWGGGRPPSEAAQRYLDAIERGRRRARAPDPRGIGTRGDAE